jgi:regulator of protease activity HflC (stomatin/prohibitin superfamily)
MQNPPNQVTTTATAIERYQEGWRSGKPVEDPDKLKSWGFVGAKPSEYLVCTRAGQVDRKRSGQGRRIFKWPWHAVAIVPTTLQRLEFTADQITRERTGVAVTGVAVFRIAEPLLAYRVLNFTFPEAASEKLAETLREMFVGAARRVIANLSLDECLTRRKETIAGYLLDEIAPVIGGRGAPGDTTMQGWGVVIDTIEIQQVRIQSTQVFAHLQAPYRAEIATRAQLAELQRARAVTEQQIRIAEEQRRAKASAEIAALEAERARAQAAQLTAVMDVEHERALKEQRQANELDLARKQADAALELRRRESDARDGESVQEATHQRRMAEIEQLLAHTRTARDLVTHALPKIAEALNHSMGTVNYTQIGGDGSAGPLGAVPAALAQLLALARSFGVELPRRDD